ncbi:MAG: SGNH/GDSL hydrolase family protein [Candidatus Omnitrophica bacterium]|nr:SGNH/GDSL hydrolase family protein [Candidatus Omnitrophota bacterium]
MRQIFEYHPVIGYRFIPVIKARVPHEGGGYLIQTNNKGFRCTHDVTEKKRESVFRVILFGDSFTAGDGVSNQFRYSDLLEQRIPQLEFLNFALPGTGTDQHYLIFKEYAAHIEYNAAVIAVWVENVRRVGSRYRLYQDDQGRDVLYAKPYFEFDNGQLVLRNTPVPREPIPESELSKEDERLVDWGGRFLTLRNVADQLGFLNMARRLSRYQPMPEYKDPQNSSWRVMRAILLEWIRSCAKPVVLMPIPIYHYVECMSDPRHYQARFRELAEEAGCILHDPLPDLTAYSPEKRRGFRFKNDVHPTPQGHEALADSLRPAIEKLMIDGKTGGLKT